MQYPTTTAAGTIKKKYVHERFKFFCLADPVNMFSFFDVVEAASFFDIVLPRRCHPPNVNLLGVSLLVLGCSTLIGQYLQMHSH